MFATWERTVGCTQIQATYKEMQRGKVGPMHASLIKSAASTYEEQFEAHKVRVEKGRTIFTFGSRIIKHLR